MSSICMQHISKSYGNDNILDDFNIEVNDHEFVTVIGGSGSGKTTVLKLINGLLKPDQGTILIDQKDISSMDQNELRRDIGYVIQNIGLFPHMNIKKNIAYVLTLRKWPKERINTRIDELMNIIHMDTSILSRYPDELSGGQKQRVGIARALAAQPSLLLMDEPFGAVDEIIRHQLQDELISIHKEFPITIFFITHDIKEALRLGNRVLILKDGKIEQFATPENILTSPASDYVKQLLSYTNI